MAIRSGVGRTAKFIANAPNPLTGRSPLITAGIVGAGAVGVGSAVLDREGPYADLQEAAFGDRDAFRYSMQAGLSTAFGNDDNIEGVNDRYYGRPINPTQFGQRHRSSGSTTPVSGDVVFGLYNLRR